MSAHEMQPDVDDVLQVEPGGAEPSVKVDVNGPVRTQVLPRKAGATFTKIVTSTTPVQLLTADPRRAKAILYSDDNIYVAFSQSGAYTAASSFKLLGGPSFHLPIEAVVDVWVMAVTTTTNVSVMTELWATGQGSE